jgi:peptide/nickel transport system permease protein
VVATLELAFMIIYESALSFLGLGVQPPTPTWGWMLADGRNYVATAWWLATFPGLAIMLTVLAVNLLGDWLRDTLDPRLTV